MVEMQELSNILHSATEESLVILDEVGRGTATYDGISIAWAATEYLHNRVRARTLFATHYHELTTLADHLPRVENVHVAVDDGGHGSDSEAGDVTFLWTVREGPTDRSYGVHVADIAGVPGPVVDRAGEVLDRLREEKAIEARGGDAGPGGGSGDGTTQAVFDLSAGSFADSDTGAGDGSAAGAGGGTDARVDDADTAVASDGRGGPTPTLDPDVEAVIEEITDVDVNETPPLELATRVQEWQRRVDDAE
jgi:DNA mismatch repair protein MutS